MNKKNASLLSVLMLLTAACSEQTPSTSPSPSTSSTKTIAPSENNGGITLPDNFAARVIDEGVGEGARHLVVRENGDIYVKLQKLANGKGIVALRDTDNDGIIDEKKSFGDFIGTGIDVDGEYLYASSPKEVYRFPIGDDEFVPSAAKELVISNFPEQHDHWSKPFTFDEQHSIYVTVGSPSNACQQTARSPGSPGIHPCPQIDLQAGIWKYDARILNQKHGQDGEVYGIGIRNAVALDWNHHNQSLFAVQHGRDQLNTLWPKLYSAEDNAQLPGEEFIAISAGDDFGWPYCYYDQRKGKKVLGPEYGGDGEQQSLCASKAQPLLAFPGHMAPNDVLFYQGQQFPQRYKNGAFVAFHGSWNRAPLPQAGYKVAFVPFVDGKPTGEWEIFADGFAGGEEIHNPRDAKHRPMGLAEGPDGSLYISDSVKGKIWRVMYYGERSYTYEKVEKSQIKEARLQASTADKREKLESQHPGKKIYDTYCLVCHQKNGLGVAGLNPPLTSQEWVGGSDKKLIRVILDGLAGATVDGENYRNIMPPHAHLNDTQIADVLSYVRSSFGNNYPVITKDAVADERAGGK